MKKIMKLVLVSSVLIFLSGCNSSIDRIDRTFTLLQDNITKIVNELTEIQLSESHLQKDFETTLSATEDLSAFKKEDSVINQNLTQRKDHIKKLDELIEEIDNLHEEISSQNFSDDSLKTQAESIQEQIVKLSSNLKVYTKDYKSNLELERLTYESIANPDIDYDSFFKVFENINTLALTNQMNLEKVLGFFEDINTKLINIKVYLTTLKEQ